MIDLSGIIKKEEMSIYRLAKILEKPYSQVFDWVKGKFNPSPLMEEYIKGKLKENNLDLIDK